MLCNIWWPKGDVVSSLMTYTYTHISKRKQRYVDTRVINNNNKYSMHKLRAVLCIRRLRNVCAPFFLCKFGFEKKHEKKIIWSYVCCECVCVRIFCYTCEIMREILMQRQQQTQQKEEAIKLGAKKILQIIEKQ